MKLFKPSEKCNEAERFDMPYMKIGVRNLNLKNHILPLKYLF